MHGLFDGLRVNGSNLQKRDECKSSEKAVCLRQSLRGGAHSNRTRQNLSLHRNGEVTVANCDPQSGPNRTRSRPSHLLAITTSWTQFLRIHEPVFEEYSDNVCSGATLERRQMSAFGAQSRHRPRRVSYAFAHAVFFCRPRFCPGFRPSPIFFASARRFSA